MDCQKKKKRKKKKEITGLKEVQECSDLITWSSQKLLQDKVTRSQPLSLKKKRTEEM